MTLRPESSPCWQAPPSRITTAHRGDVHSHDEEAGEAEDRALDFDALREVRQELARPPGPGGRG